MEPDLKTVNDYLVSVFNDILTIEESELKKSQFKDLSITEMHISVDFSQYSSIKKSCKEKTGHTIVKPVICLLNFLFTTTGFLL